MSRGSSKRNSARSVRNSRLACLYGGILSVFSLAASAATDAPAGVGGKGPLAVTSLGQFTVGLVVVLVFIGVLVWLLRRFGRFDTAAQGNLQILGGLSVGTRERVLLVKVADTELLLGVAPGRVQTLHVLEHPSQISVAGSTGAGFADKLQSVVKRLHRPGAPHATDPRGSA